jgi:rRNA-processing protein FCF1
MVEIFLDTQILGVVKYLEAVGIKVKTDALIRGTNDTREPVPDDKIQEFVAAHPGVILVTKDKKFGRKAKGAGLQVILLDESQVLAFEVLRQLAER